MTSMRSAHFGYTAPAAAVNCSPGMAVVPRDYCERRAASTGCIRIGLINRAVNLAIRPGTLTPRQVRDHWNDPITTLMVVGAIKTTARMQRLSRQASLSEI